MTSRAECSPRKIRRIQKKKKEGEDEKMDKNDKENGKKDNDNKDNVKKDNSDKDDRDKDSGDKKNDDEESKGNLVYGFYRLIIHPMILRLKSQRGTTNNIIYN